MAVDLAGVITGGAIGLMGGIGGVFLGHHLSQRRERASRKIEGLRQVVAEINRFSRVALFFEQQINLASRDQEAEGIAKNLIGRAEWQNATHELQEAHWRFPAMAYLPNATSSFHELNRLMGYIMDPYARTKSPELELTSEEAWEQFKKVSWHIQSLVEAELRKLA